MNQLDYYVPPTALVVVERLGEGAFARVDKSWYSSPDGKRCLVAVKRLKKEHLCKPADVEMFIRETQLMRNICHKNLVELVGVGELVDGKQRTPYMVQEYMGGGTVRQLVTREMLHNGRPGYSDVDAISICLQMAEGLEHMHTRIPMIIHRDLKLENVMLARPYKLNGSFEVKLGDFGLSKKVDAKMRRLRIVQTSPEMQPIAELSVARSSGVSRSSASSLGEALTRWSLQHARQPTAAAPQEGHFQDHLLRVDSAALPDDRGHSLPPMVHKEKLEADWTSRMRTFSSQQPLNKGSGRGLPVHVDAADGMVPSPNYDLTGQTGSLMYMSPEVFLQQRYNEKADVFSFGMMMYEVMQRYLTINAVVSKGTYEELCVYAARVARGYRPPISQRLPPDVTQLLQDCWAQDAAQRPSMTEVVARLKEALDTARAAETQQHSGCSCAIC